MSEALQQIGYALTLYVTVPIVILWAIFIVVNYHRHKRIKDRLKKIGGM